MQPIATLDGDIDKVVPLANGYFFAHYADLALPHGVWEIETRKMVQAGDDVVTEDYDNRIFALRRKERFDEVWRTDPLRELTAVLGRVQTVTTIQGSDYFVVQYEGDKPAEIWLDEAPPKIVITLRGPIDTSITYLDQGYFFLRYNDLSRSEIWSSKPPKLLATLNGNLATTDVKAALGQEVVVFQYTDNAISELWSLKDVKPIAKLNGDAAYIKSILGDTYFVVRYRGEQPAEVWSAISGQLIGKLGDKQKLVQDVAVIQDGNYVAVFYADAPAEIWQVETNQVRLFASLPDAATNMYALNPDFFLINYKTKPAQIWQIGKDTPVLNMKDTIEQASYSYAIQWLTYTTPDQKAYGVNMGTLHDLLAGDNPPDETALITLACTQVSQNPPIPDDVLQTYLGGLPSTACLSPAAEATVEAELSEATEPAAPEVNTDTQ
jgi:WD40 repeat protein